MHEHFARAIGRAGYGVVHDEGTDAGAAFDQLVDAVDEAAAAGHDDAVLVQIAHQLRRRTLQDETDGVEDMVHGLHKGFDQFRGADSDGFGQAVGKVPALDFLKADVGPLDYAADVSFEFFGGAQADQKIIFAADKLDNRLVKAGARDLDGLAFHHAAARDDGNLGRAAADVDDHVPVRLGDVNARAHGGGDGRLQQIDLARAGFDGRVDHRAFLHAGDGAGDAGQHARLKQAEGGDAADKLAQHLGRDLVVRDDARVYRVDRHNIRRGPAQHLLRVLADFQDFAAEFVHRDDGGLSGDDALALLKQQRGRGAEINGYISLKQIHDKLLLYACCLEAAAAATTSPQPACFSTAAHSDSVAPVVTISSISSTRLPAAFEGAQQT